MIDPVIVSVLVLYLGILFGIGFWARTQSRTIKGYFLAGKSLPSWVIAFSSNATGESAWLLLGLTGMGYLVGVHAFWIVLGEVFGVTIAWLYVARPFKAQTDRFDSITVPDYLETRFRDDRNLFRKLAAVIIFSMVAFYTAAQLTAAGKAFDIFLGTGYLNGVLIGAAIVMFYTAVGGFKAVAYSDLFQGLLMLSCLFVLPVVGIVAAGGWSSMIDNLGAQNPFLLTPMGSEGLSVKGIVAVLGFMGIGLAFLGAPQLLARFMSARNDRELVRASLPAVVCIIVFDVGAILSGMAGRALFPGLGDPESVLPVMSQALFHPVFTGIFLVVILAAMMSTIDSLLILASSTLIRDVLQKTLGSRASDARLATYGKLATLLLGSAAVALAVTEAKVIFWFVLFAWSGLACAFAPPVLCALFWQGTTRQGALAGMAGGFIVTVAWAAFFKASFHDLYEMIPGFAAGLLLTVVVSLGTGTTREPVAARGTHI
jgi:sodium/proline symporter